MDNRSKHIIFYKFLEINLDSFKFLFTRSGMSHAMEKKKANVPQVKTACHFSTPGYHVKIINFLKYQVKLQKM